MRKVSAKNKGFTLLELVISLALIAILIIPISNLVLGSVKINKAGEDKQQAGLKLQEVIENIKLVDLPKNVDEKIEVGNGVYVVKDVGGAFSISDSNNKDIKIEGTIKKTVLSEGEEVSNSIGDTEITGAIYYDGESKRVAISEYDSNKKLSEAVENINTSVTRSVKDMILKISKLNNENIKVTCINKNGSEQFYEHLKTKAYNSDSILLYLNNNEAEKLDLKLKSVEGKELNIYLFKDDGIASRDDISLLSLEGNVNIISGLTKENISNLITYEVTLSAIKGEKQLESTSFTMIK
ncbi:MAG: prepilin-type N-terminal cleavage/methylation domain-containing protein [Clostridium sp.]|nr:prepilin-type N-terminal cleavage/methylation domain-containing protein [Clostridium sp.]